MTPMRKLEAKEPPSDAALIARVRDGELGSLGILYDRHAPAVRRVLVRLGIQSQDVDDLVQATFLEVVRSASRYDGRDSARPWLTGIAVMQTRRTRRSLSRWTARLVALAKEPEPSPRPSPEYAAEQHELMVRAQSALQRLGANKREAFVLVSIEGLSCEDAAHALGIPVGTVWTRLHHARAELRAMLFPEDR